VRQPLATLLLLVVQVWSLLLLLLLLLVLVLALWQRLLLVASCRPLQLPGWPGWRGVAAVVPTANGRRTTTTLQRAHVCRACCSERHAPVRRRCTTWQAGDSCAPAGDIKRFAHLRWPGVAAVSGGMGALLVALWGDGARRRGAALQEVAPVGRLPRHTGRAAVEARPHVCRALRLAVTVAVTPSPSTTHAFLGHVRRSDERVATAVHVAGRQGRRRFSRVRSKAQCVSRGRHAGMSVMGGCAVGQRV
jgi:hypothetical protein